MGATFTVAQWRAMLDALLARPVPQDMKKQAEHYVLIGEVVTRLRAAEQATPPVRG